MSDLGAFANLELGMGFPGEGGEVRLYSTSLVQCAAEGDYYIYLVSLARGGGGK